MFEGCIRHEVDGRRSSVPRHIAFTEIPDEVVVRRFRPDLGNVTEASGHAPLHVEPREFLDDHCDLRSRDELVLEPYHVQADACSAKRHLRLLVEADQGRGVEGDAVPDQLGSALVKTALRCEDPGQIGAFNLETAWTVEALIERDVVQQRSQGDHFRVVINAPKLPDPYRNSQERTT